MDKKMSLTSRKNLTVKALQSMLAKNKKNNDSITYEWEIACNTNVNRGNVYSQEHIINNYSRSAGWYEDYGCSKICHLKNENGEDFNYIVIKRSLENCWMPTVSREIENGLKAKCTGNQLLDEINCWLEFENTENADLLCPILKYFTSKSDKVTATSEKMQNNIIIIAQKAIYVNTAKYACLKAQSLNEANGLNGEDADARYKKLSALSRKQGWRDAMNNSGNSGVIFDYNKNCYKAVFIDYAL